ncbi:hypothetical protein ACFY5D_10370 [Paeniglutamicibacter sp. NPDC012692]|uniref:hypothetical protein n=1 Tax=Paeniglutamicibacter sp. NPDC012692 TaxID=3364388 RepID=UPI0036C3A495
MPTQPLVSIDAVPLILHEGSLHLVLGVREYDPFAGRAALPGVLLNAHERLAEAVHRALLSKTGVPAGAVLAGLEAGVFDDFERDERGPTLSIARLVILDEKTPMTDPRVRLEPLADLPELPFDHRAIVAKAATVLLDSLWINLETTKALLGESFDTAELIARMKELASAAELPMPETANIGRALGSNKLLERVAPAAASSGRGRPPALWRWI